MDFSWSSCCLEISDQNAKAPKNVGTVGQIMMFLLEATYFWICSEESVLCRDTIFISSIRPNI